MRTILVFIVVLFAGCTSCSDPLLQKQCDASRRCTPADEPVCGTDGRWYDCELLAECEGVTLSSDDAVCGDPGNNDDNNDNNIPVCPDIACAPCDGLVETYDDDGCLVDCRCPDQCEPVACDRTRTGPDGCPVCVDDCNTPTCDAAGCSLVTPPDGGCPQCVCDPLCEPLDRASCESDPDCSVALDPNGCETCMCEEDPGECQRLFCDVYCPQGYVIENGCPTCQCYEPCLGRPECDLACPTGNQIDLATGCSDSCACVADTCDAVACDLACDYGFRVGSDGCEVCECRGFPCSIDEDCGFDERCIFPGQIAFNGEPDGAPIAPPQGECVALDRCDPEAEVGCDDGGQCGFYYRSDCCPPLTTCIDSNVECPAVCLLDFGDLG